MWFAPSIPGAAPGQLRAVVRAGSQPLNWIPATSLESPCFREPAPGVRCYCDLVAGLDTISEPADASKREPGYRITPQLRLPLSVSPAARRA